MLSKFLFCVSLKISFLCLYRPAGGVHHESHDEEAIAGAVHAVCGSDPQSALLPEAVSRQTSLPVEGDVDSSHHASQVHSDQ